MPKIRITKKDKQEYARLRKNAKAKIRRVQKSYGVDLSDSISLPSLDEFSTRSGYNEWKEKVGSFLNRANTNYQFTKTPSGEVLSKHEVYLQKKDKVTNIYGVTKSKFDINQARAWNKKAQTEAFKRIAKTNVLPVYDHHGNIVMTVEQYRKMLARPDGINVPPVFNFNQFRNEKDFETYKEAMQRRATSEYYEDRVIQMHQNFIDKLMKTFGKGHEVVDWVIDSLERLNPEDFYDLYFMDPENFNFKNYWYEQQGNDFDTMYGTLGGIEKTLEKFFKGELNEDIRDFRSFGNKV